MNDNNLPSFLFHFSFPGGWDPHATSFFAQFQFRWVELSRQFKPHNIRYFLGRTTGESVVAHVAHTHTHTLRPNIPRNKITLTFFCCCAFLFSLPLVARNDRTTQLHTAVLGSTPAVCASADVSARTNKVNTKHVLHIFMRSDWARNICVCVYVCERDRQKTCCFA